MEEIMKNICKSIKENTNDGATHETFGVDRDSFIKAIEECENIGYIKGGTVVRNGARNEVYGCGISKAILTLKGLKFISEE